MQSSFAICNSFAIYEVTF